MVKNLPANAGDGGFNHWVKKIPWRRKWPSTPVFLPAESHGGAWPATDMGYIESDTPEQLAHVFILLQLGKEFRVN